MRSDVHSEKSEHRRIVARILPVNDMANYGKDKSRNFKSGFSPQEKAGQNFANCDQ